MPEEDTQVNFDAPSIAEASQKIGEEITYTAGNLVKHFVQAMAAGAQPREIFGLEPAQMEAIYGRAYGHFNAGQYEQAKQHFRMLSMTDPMDPRYSFGLAACFHMLKEYDVAAAAYNITSTQDPHNPMPSFHAADCEMQLDHQPAAYELFKATILRCGDRKEFAQVKEKAKLLMEGIKQAQLKKKAAKEDKKIL